MPPCLNGGVALALGGSFGPTRHRRTSLGVWAWCVWNRAPHEPAPLPKPQANSLTPQSTESCHIEPDSRQMNMSLLAEGAHAITSTRRASAIGRYSRDSPHPYPGLRPVFSFLLFVGSISAPPSPRTPTPNGSASVTPDGWWGGKR